MKRITDTGITERIVKAEASGDFELVCMLLELKQFRVSKRFNGIIRTLNSPHKEQFQKKFKMSLEERGLII